MSKLLQQLYRQHKRVLFQVTSQNIIGKTRLTGSQTFFPVHASLEGGDVHLLCITVVVSILYIKLNFSTKDRQTIRVQA